MRVTEDKFWMKILEADVQYRPIMKENFLYSIPFKFPFLGKRGTLSEQTVLQICTEELKLYATDTRKGGTMETTVVEEDRPINEGDFRN